MRRMRDGELLGYITIWGAKKITERFKRLSREFSDTEVKFGGKKQTHENFLSYLLDIHQTGR